MASAIPPEAPAPAPSPLAAQFEQALALHQQGQLQEAAGLYQAILDRDPAHFDALHLLGVVAAQSGDPTSAVTLIDRALAVDSGQAPAHYHRALALRDVGRNEDALNGFAAVVALDPAHADAWVSHAETLQELQRLDQAAASYGRALELAPGRVETWFARGVLQQNLQRHAEALADYDRALALQPNFAGALHNRALTLQALQRPADALASYERLLELAPEHPPAHYGRGLALQGLQRPAEALAAFERALVLQPDWTDAQLQRVRVLRQLGRYDAALEACAALLAAAPARADAWFEHGGILQAQERNEEALQSYDRALAAQPAFAEACNNRALALLGLGRPAEALDACAAALALNPDFAEAWSNRGLALSTLPGRGQDALDSYARAIELRPTYAEAWANRGHLLRELQRLEQGLESYQRALAIEPDNPEHLYGCGTLLQLLERHEDALACYDRALALRPAYLQALTNRGGVLERLQRYGAAADSYTRLLALNPGSAPALGNRLHARLFDCDWREYAQDVAQVTAAVAAGRPADQPFSFLAVTDSAQAQLQCARLRAAAYPPAAVPLWQGTRYNHPRLRLAYVSGDLRSHAVAVLLAEVLERHDRRRFELIAISLRPPAPDVFGQRVAAAFERFVDVSARSDLEVARLMREMEIDVAVDLMGYTNLPRTGIFAHRPAPVQASYLGFAGTLATSYTDYLIADAVAVPAATARYYSEQVVRLPAGFMPRDTTVAPGPIPARSAAGLPEHGFVFCCFNNAYKFNPPVFAVWMRLLQAVPGSVLWLTAPGPDAQAHLLDEARRRGVVPQRIVFAAKTPGIAEHLGRIALADLFLDTLPYNAHTTASDALWAGVPLITCAGEAFASRVAASLLTAAGLPELVTSSLVEYEALALQLARAPARLAELRERLARRRAAGTLFNTERLCRQLESAYLAMHERQHRGLRPAAFSVAD